LTVITYLQVIGRPIFGRGVIAMTAASWHWRTW